MKVPINEIGVVDLDAPVLPAYAVEINGSTYWLVSCGHCRVWHRHGPAEGHREAHCTDPTSPYWRSGYNLAYGGRWEDRQSPGGSGHANPG